ncbi:MAG: hypothetical protein QOK02_1287 [Mycobacterium sp.]|jgi:NAD(P)-dependent dehydrogenase (short-subunit alcohol dehydrogenase family)|nr:hypothetical protein [Mycobacterium sp.]
MTTTLITGADEGRGFEAARQLTAVGHCVHIGSRDPGRGRCAAARIGARFVQLDVTDEVSVAAAAECLCAHGGLDVLVNNAGTAEWTPDGRFSTGGAGPDLVRMTFDVNVFGVMRVTNAFLPLLQRSKAPVIVNVSSSLSLTRNLIHPDSPAHDYPGLAYPASKAALNVITVQYAKAFPGIRVNAVGTSFAPGSDGGIRTQNVAQDAEVITRMAKIARMDPAVDSSISTVPLLGDKYSVTAKATPGIFTTAMGFDVKCSRRPRKRLRVPTSRIAAPEECLSACRGHTRDSRLCPPSEIPLPR